MAGPLRLMIDENIPLVIAQVLRDNRIDALHVEEADLKGAEDIQILHVAASERRIVVTRDVKDYIRPAELFRVTAHDLEGILLVGHRIPAGPAAYPHPGPPGVDHCRSGGA